MGAISHSPAYYDRYHSADGFSQHDIDTQRKWEQFIEDFQEHAIDFECDKVGASDEPCEFSLAGAKEKRAYPKGVRCRCLIHNGKAFINNPFYEE